MLQEWIIRKETSDDHDSIDAVITAASGEQEAVDVVRRLRRDGDALLSLVAEVHSRVIGHIMMSRMSIDTGERELPAVALAPLMVDPAYQNRGVGTQLTQEALRQCRDLAESIVFVLGHPTYYPRFGFSAEIGERFQIPFKLTTPGAFMALELKPGATTELGGKVKYARAFGLPAEWSMRRERNGANSTGRFGLFQNF